MRVVEAVAEADGVDPASLEPPLNDVVDAAALDRLFEDTAGVGRTSQGRIRFEYHGYDVTVHADGRVVLD